MSPKINLRDIGFIFEDRFLFEEGVYRAYTTDEKRNIDPKETKIGVHD